jgi:uncharacterized membrane protein YGL010W
MKTIEQWLNDYQNDHRNPTNQILHKICVPAIVYSLLGLFYSIPFPFSGEHILERMFMNWAAVFAIFAMVFYVRLVPHLAAFLLAAILAILSSFTYWETRSSETLLPFCGIVFFVAWVGQFVGHKIEGKKPSFFKDLQFLLIGPIWVLASTRNHVKCGHDKHCC